MPDEKDASARLGLEIKPGIELTRRAVLTTAAAVAFVPLSSLRCAAQAAAPHSLTAAQRRTTEMLVDRIIPSDELGPGALECGAANYIDVQMADYLAPQLPAWIAGLDELDALARRISGAPFADLSADARDRLLNLILGIADGFATLQTFFNTARTYTLQGTFGDPHYGGNTGGKGWDIIRYPGPRAATTADMQRMDKPAEPYRRSAWGNE